MQHSFAAKYQLLLSSILLGIFISLVLMFPACMDDTSQQKGREVFEPNLHAVLSASQKLGKLNAILEEEKIRLDYIGEKDESVIVRIYDEKNNLIYGAKDFLLRPEIETHIDFKEYASGMYQLYIFFDNGEFLNTELEIPRK